MEIHVGCSGWFYSHWRGVLYPREEPSTALWFGYYAEVFRTVELNAPFYRWPRPATVRRWKRDAPPGFRYAVKAHARLTHEKGLVRTRRLVADFCSLAETLGEHFGCLLFQFPPRHHYSRSRLASIVRQLGGRPAVAVEFRHRSWWREAVFRAFDRAGLIFCSVSGPRLPDRLVVTSGRIYLRFHGRTRWYRHDYTDAELAPWVERVAASGAREAWIYFNNDREGHAVRNARRFRRLLVTRLRLPPELRNPPPASARSTRHEPPPAVEKKIPPARRGEDDALPRQPRVGPGARPSRRAPLPEPRGQPGGRAPATRGGAPRRRPAGGPARKAADLNGAASVPVTPAASRRRNTRGS
jgi:uncharacterized protein YecE (DUF72 family)